MKNRLEILALLILTLVAGALWSRRLASRPAPAVLVEGPQVEGPAVAADCPESSRWPDWSRFMGPKGTGESLEPLPESLPAAVPEKTWRIALNGGFGGAAVRDGRVYIVDRRDQELDVLLCLDLARGEKIWEFSAKSPGRVSYDGARATPTVTEKEVVFTSPMGGIYVVERDNGALRWRTDLVNDFQASPPGFGFAASALVFENHLIIPSHAETHGLLALDLADGHEVWRSREISAGGFVTPVLAQLCGRAQLLMLCPSGVYGLDPASGATLWSSEILICGTVIPAPLPLADGRMFLTAGYGAGSAMIRVQEKGPSYEVQKLFVIPDLGAQVQAPLVVAGQILANFNRNENLPRDPDGLVLIRPKDGRFAKRGEDKPPVERGPFIAHGHRVLSLGGDDGILRLLEVKDGDWEERGALLIFEGLRRRDNQIWAPLAWAKGFLLARSQKELVCLPLKP